jgi:hypothetical protein
MVNWSLLLSGFDFRSRGWPPEEVVGRKECEAGILAVEPRAALREAVLFMKEFGGSDWLSVFVI